jgi:hypothetical protein
MYVKFNRYSLSIKLDSFMQMQVVLNKIVYLGKTRFQSKVGIFLSDI